MSRARRREKRFFEPIDIIGIDNPEVNVKEPVTTETVPGGDIVREKPTKVVSIEEPVEVDELTALNRLTGMFIPPPITTIDNAPPKAFDLVTSPKIEGFTVSDGTPYATEPIDDTIDGLPKVFGRKSKKPVSVNS